MERGEGFEALWALLEEAKSKGFGGSLEVLFPWNDEEGKAYGPAVSVFVADDVDGVAKITTPPVVAVHCEPVEKIGSVVESVRAALEKRYATGRRKTDEELAAEAYGVSVRELTLGQLEDFKEMRKEKEE